MKYHNIESKLQATSQDFILKHFKSLDEQSKQLLANDIAKVDIEKLLSLFESGEKLKAVDDVSVERLEVYEKGEFNAEYYDKGIATLSKGRVALLILSGGMGSRLGFDYPKGMFEVLENKSIFEVFFTRLLRLSDKAKCRFHIFIMTSISNHNITVDFFKKNNYFNYGKDYVHFFSQGVLPTLTADKKLLLQDKNSLVMTPDGNGGVFKAINESFVKEKLIQHNIEWLNVVGIDNVLLKPLDPEYIGVCVDKGYNLASKSVIRTYDYEKVGLMLRKNGRPAILEYTEVTDEMRLKKMANDEYYFADANIVNHLFNVPKLLSFTETELDYHLAFKKVPYFDGQQYIKPETENAYKFEQFLFDIFPKFDDMLIYRVSRQAEFSPLKNKTGSDSIETAKQDLLREGI